VCAVPVYLACFVQITAVCNADVQVASKRFIDTAAMDIRKELLKEVADIDTFTSHMDR
jgi:hypothetical protein